MWQGSQQKWMLSASSAQCHVASICVVLPKDPTDIRDEMSDVHSNTQLERERERSTSNYHYGCKLAWWISGRCVLVKLEFYGSPAKRGSQKGTLSIPWQKFYEWYALKTKGLHFEGIWDAMPPEEVPVLQYPSVQDLPVYRHRLPCYSVVFHLLSTVIFHLVSCWLHCRVVCETSPWPSAPGFPWSCADIHMIHDEGKCRSAISAENRDKKSR